MPIERRPVVHRFGIFTEARRDELVRKVMSDDGHLYLNQKSPRYSPEGIEETVSRLNSTTTQIELLSLEDEAWSLLQKVKYKVTSLENKKGLNDFKKCWTELTLFISSKSRKIQYEALAILRKSLCDAPLSKSLMATLLDMAVSNIRVFCSEDNPYPWETKYLLLLEVIFLICSRLFYHCVVRDTKELESEKLREIYLLNKALDNTIIHYQDNPILTNLLLVINHMIIAVCPGAEIDSSIEIDERGTPYTSTDEKQKIKTAYVNPSLDSTIAIENESDSQSSEERHIKDKTDSELKVGSANENESDGQSKKEKEIIYAANPKATSSSDENSRRTLARFLWYSLKLWQCASREMEVTSEIVDKLRLVDFSGIDTKYSEWLDSILSFYILCECSKLKIEFLRIFLNFRTKMVAKTKNFDLEDNYKITWNIELIITYLKCLADVSMFGISILTQKLALLGDEKLYGLVDYLDYIPDNENSSKVRICTYQLLCDVYSFYRTDPMKDGLKNITWKSIMNFKSSAEINSLSPIQNYHFRTSDYQQSSIGPVFSKIGTNMCVIAFSSLHTPVKSRNSERNSQMRPKNSKCFENEIKKEVNDRGTGCGQKPQIKIKPQEHERWSEVQKIAAEHYEKELQEDEAERALLHQEKSDDGEQSEQIL